MVGVPEDPLEFEGVVVHRDRLAVPRVRREQVDDNFAPFYGKLANVALPYGDLTADKIGVGIAIATGAAIAGHAVVKAVRGKSDDDSKKE